MSDTPKDTDAETPAPQNEAPAPEAETAPEPESKPDPKPESGQSESESGTTKGRQTLGEVKARVLKKKEDVEPQPKDEIESAVEQSSVQEEKKLRRKKHMKYGAAGIGALVLAYVIYLLFVPYTGTMAFGICKAFLELNVRYPNTLRISTVEETGTSVRIWYTQVDAFGEYRMEPIQCYYRPDETFGYALDKVTVRRREVDPKKVEDFNRVLGTVLEYPPDLTLPIPLPDSLDGLQIETDKFRKPIL